MPYIASWSAETEAADFGRVIQTERGIGYADEMLWDRDTRGVLWRRVPSQPGVGEPQYGTVHSLRQRRAMRRLLCQVCGGPSDHNELGTLWLLRDYRYDWPGWPERMGNSDPPLCLRCARIAVRACPWLRPGFVAVRAHSTVTGVHGARYRPGYPFPQPTNKTTIAYGSPEIRWVKAAHLIRTLKKCTLVTL